MLFQTKICKDGKSDVMHRCSSKIDTNRMQACVIVISDEKKRENDPTEHQIVCNTVKLDKKLFYVENFLVKCSLFLSQYSKHYGDKDFDWQCHVTKNVCLVLVKS